LRQFEEIFCGFPFVDPDKEGLQWNLTASYAVALAGILSLVARPYLGLGAIPLIGATAPSRRSGKTKIIESCCMSAMGHRPTACHFTDEVEFDKHVQPLMRAGDRAILIDNVERSLQSSKLCILVTGGVLRDRILGESRDVILKNYSVIFATGNNLVFGGDLSSRAIRCDIDPREERPESRAFQFDPVRLAQERHPELVVAALTMLRGYLFAGSPWNLKREPWGGFEGWDKLVSGCLVWLGIADPYEARERIISSEPIRMINVDILEAWHLMYGQRTVSFADIRREKGEVYDILLKKGTWDGHYAQWVLRRLEGQTIGGYRLERMLGRSHFRVVQAGSQKPFNFGRTETTTMTDDKDARVPF
jgi:putative DNA primase/helicase